MELAENKTSKKEKVPKPKYNLFQNSGYMIAIAWQRQKSVLWLCLVLAALAVASNLAGLYIAPMILGAIESGVSIDELIKTILIILQI